MHAQKLGVKNEDVITITSDGRSIEMPVWVMPGTADNTIAVHGRTPFVARYDGTDRWLQRAMVVSDLAASAADPFVPDAAWPARQWLQAVCEAQRAYRDAHGEYAALDALGVPAPADVDATLSRGIVTRTHASLFEATVDSRAGGRTATWHIRQDGRVWRGGSPVS